MERCLELIVESSDARMELRGCEGRRGTTEGKSVESSSFRSSGSGGILLAETTLSHLQTVTVTRTSSGGDSGK